MRLSLQTSVSAKIITIVVVSILVINIVVYALSDFVILNSYTNLERDRMEQSLKQVDDAFQGNVDGMWLKIKDWGFWDDLYAYARGHGADHSFAEQNFADNGLVNVDINLLMYVDLQGNIIFKKVVDRETGLEIADSKVPEHLLSAEKKLIMGPDANENSVARGVVLLPEGPLLVASVPILRTDRTGPSVGTLLFGTFVDASSTEHVAQLTHLSVRGFPYGSASFPADVASAMSALSKKNNFLVKPLSGAVVAGYTALYDLNDRPILALRVEKPREIYNQGRITLVSFVITTSVVLLILGLAIVLLLDKYVISRLAKLSREVLDIGATHNLIARVKESTNDEVGTLARAINNMLTDLSNAHTKEADLRVREKEASEQLKDRMGKIEELNKLMVGRARKVVELKETLAHLRKELGESETSE